jgi:hypothetical protein
MEYLKVWVGPRWVRLGISYLHVEPPFFVTTPVVAVLLPSHCVSEIMLGKEIKNKHNLVGLNS